MGKVTKTKQQKKHIKHMVDIIATGFDILLSL